LIAEKDIACLIAGVETGGKQDTNTSKGISNLGDQKASDK
jgi:hypothetical protein